MSCDISAPSAARARTPRGASGPSGRLPLGITVFSCEPDEAVLFRQLAPAFGVVPTILVDPVSEGTAQAAAGSHCISVGHKTPVSNATLATLSRLGIRYVSTRSIGCNHIDVDFAASVGITVGTVTYSPDSVADYTLMLMSLRHMRATLTRTNTHDYRLAPTRGRELRDLTVGVVGTGRIGTAVLDRLHGFGCRILAHDSRTAQQGAYVDLDTLLSQSDIVTLHTPLTDRTHHLLNAERIQRMKPGAYLVNTGRGALIDTARLVAALERGHLGGAALDVIEGEDGIFYADRRTNPIDNDLFLRLHRLPNVLITPHTAYYTDHALRDTVEHTLTNCLTHESGHNHD